MAKKSASLDLPSFTQPSKTARLEPKVGTPPPPSVSYPVEKPAPCEHATLPLLPRAKRPSFSSHRNDANAALALDLLTDVQDAILTWHQGLRDTLLKIQQLYMTGPIVDGWLEAVNQQETQNRLEEQAAVLRHGDPEQVANYVAQLSEQAAANPGQTGTQYHLCSLDADGQMQCEVCPPEQLGVISQAIARNQQLRELVSQKQYLEAKLKRASEALEVTRKTLNIRPTAGADTDE